MYPELTDINFTQSIKQSVQMDINGKHIYIQTPRIYIPFGLNKYYNSWTLNFQLRHLKDTLEVQEFYAFIKSLENFLIEKINVTPTEFNSQLSETNKKYDPIIYSKILEKNDKILCDIVDKRSGKNEPINIFKFPKGVYAKLELYIDKIWKINGMFTYKYKVKKISIID